MTLEDMQRNWERLASEDPLWAILSEPDKKGGRWDDQEFFRTGRVQVESILRHIEASGVELKKGKALDFGCGVGRLSQPLAESFAEVYGVDISPTMVELARRHVKNSNCHFVVNAREDLSIFREGEFDFICSLLTLQHMDTAHSMRYLREFLRVLAQRGVLFFTLPASQGHWTRRSAILEVLRDRTEKFRADPTLKSILPLGILRTYFRTGRPSIQNHSVPKEVVSKVIADGGGKLLSHETVRDKVAYLTSAYQVLKE